MEHLISLQRGFIALSSLYEQTDLAHRRGGQWAMGNWAYYPHRIARGRQQLMHHSFGVGRPAPPPPPPQLGNADRLQHRLRPVLEQCSRGGPVAVPR